MAKAAGLNRGERIMKYKTEISRRNYKAGYVIIRGIVDGSEFGGDDWETSHAETPNGDYIGNSKIAHRLCVILGIKPEKASEKHNVCSIGFCETEKKWYGWSHRAIYGFGIGAEVSARDCAYVPVNMEDARLDAIRFWSCESHINVEAVQSEDEDGKTCFDVSWTNVDDPDLIPNERIRGKIGGVRHYPPEEFGRGEWVAKTLDDAKTMAVAFAESVG
jgi:hypothetical protein